MSLVSRRLSYFLTVLAGGALGLVFGGVPFPALGDLLGSPLCDVVMAGGGATLAGIFYEIAAVFARPV